MVRNDDGNFGVLGVSCGKMGWRGLCRGNSQETAYRGCLTPFTGTRKIRHKKHLASAAFIDQSTPVPGYDHQCQGAPVSTFLGWFLGSHGAGFSVVERAKHRSIRPSTSTPSTMELNKTTPCVPQNILPESYYQQSNVGGRNTTCH